MAKGKLKLVYVIQDAAGQWYGVAATMSAAEQFITTHNLRRTRDVTAFAIPLIEEN
jgi:hypothetical protein